MQDVFEDQMKALRAASLDRHLRELAGTQGRKSKLQAVVS
jgi:hypothetical protein